MDRKSKRYSSYLTMVLMFYTFLAAAFVVYRMSNGQHVTSIISTVAKLVVCWVMRLLPQVSERAEKWIGYLFTMHSLVTFGLEPANISPLAFVTLGLCALYLAVEYYAFVNLTAAVYFLTLAGNLLFVSGGEMDFSPGVIALIVIQCAFILVTMYFAKKLKERRAENERLNQEIIDKLEDENRRTEDFLTNVSHELRTPINAVTGLTSVMLKNESDSAKRDNLFSIQKAGYRLFGQIEDILDYTEIDTNKMTASSEQYMLSSLVNDIITERSMTDSKDNLELIFDVEPKIPAMLIGDSKKIKKIIKHLVDNGLKFTDEGGVYVRIYDIPKSYGINLIIQVTDTGIGMDAQSLSRVTERFYQSSSGRERRAGGLGLGLPIVFGMVRSMDGFIHVDSKPGEGTCVTVSIPQKIADPAPGMKVEKPDSLCIACYLMPEKYKVPEVRQFYDTMILNLATGLDVPVHRVFSLGDLKKLMSAYEITHLLLADEEYEKDADYFENCDPQTQVILVAGKAYRMRKNSRVKVLRKPFHCFPVVNLLNSEVSPAAQGSRMICPDVKVLVVDDEPMNRMVAEGILRDYQMSVKTAGSGLEAIEMCGQEDFDLLFIDHMMPEMDGVETLKKLRQLNTESAQNFSAIAFTANAVSGAREMFLREGFDDFLSKPVEANELERVLKKVLPKTRIKFVDEKDIPKPAPVQDSAEEREDAGAAQDELSILQAGGINTAEAMEYCRGDKGFYIQLLQKFISDRERKQSDLDKFLAGEDYANYRIQVHSLKSSSKMMGADALSQFAKDMETASKDNNAEYIKENHAKLMEMYSQTVKLMGSAIGIAQTEETPAEEEEVTGTEISAEELCEYLSELKSSFETYEADKSQALIKELARAVFDGKPVKKLLKDIERDVEEFEYEAASEKTSALIERVKGGVGE